MRRPNWVSLAVCGHCRHSGPGHPALVLTWAQEPLAQCQHFLLAGSSVGLWLVVKGGHLGKPLLSGWGRLGSKGPADLLAQLARRSPDEAAIQHGLCNKTLKHCDGAQAEGVGMGLSSGS